MLTEAEATEQIVAEVRAAPSDVVRMSCPTALLSFQIGELIVRLITEHPAIQVHLKSTNRRVDVIAEGFDVAIRVRCGAIARWLGLEPILLSARRMVGVALHFPLAHGVP